MDNPNYAPNEQNVGFSQVVIKYGLISAAVGIISYLLMSLTGMLKVGFGTMLLNFVASLAITVYILVRQVREHRDLELGGYISFGRAFVIMLLATTISGLISGSFQYLYFNFISPNAMDELIAAQKEMAEQIAGWMGLEGDKLEAFEAQMEEQSEITKASLQSPSVILNGAFGAIFGGGILAAIIAAVMKNPKK